MRIPVASKRQLIMDPADFGMDQLDLGSGGLGLENFIEIDIDKSTGAMIIWDLRNGIPFIDNSFKYIRVHDFLEHLEPDDSKFMFREMWRVAKHDAVVDIMVPSTDGRGAFQTLDHRSFYNENSFGYWTSRTKEVDTYRGPCLFDIQVLKTTWVDTVAYVYVVMKAIKDKSWLDEYEKRCPQDFIIIP